MSRAIAEARELQRAPLLAENVKRVLFDLVDELNRERERAERFRKALRKGQAFERAYQESLGATPTTAQWERLESLQSAFLDAYLAVLAEQEKPDG